MPGEEGDLTAMDFGYEKRIAGRAIRSINFDLVHTLKQTVETRAAEDADLSKAH
jgi:hypothetical protein